jgi:large subunit ribosomal protein L13
VLRGKHKPIFSPNADVGDYIIVVNAEKIHVTGKKLNQKMYVRHSGYIGGRKETSMKDMLRRKPEYVIKHAVKGMLPKNNLGRQMFSKFHVYAGPTHKHEAQKPEPLAFN